MGKIKFEHLATAGVKTSNSIDESRVYDIEARVNIADSTVVRSIEEGIVKRENITVCTFNQYGSESLNTNFQGVSDIMAMCTILQAVDAFSKEVHEKVAEGNAVVLVNE